MMVPLTYFKKGIYGSCKILKPKILCRVQKNCKRSESSFTPKHILILTKISKYEHLKMENPNLNEDQFKEKLLSRCIDYNATFSSHKQHKETKLKLFELLKKLNIEFRIKDKYNLDCESIEWADLIMPVGGDGTFLLTSNLIVDNKIPILGFNSNPEFSEGYLMLPDKYTKNMPEVFEKLKSGHFKYLMRSRIRTTVHGDNIWETPYHLHEKNFSHMCDRFHAVHGQKQKPQGIPPKIRQLPWLALNEVFIGESMSARISALQFNDGSNKDVFRSVKCSGICVSTGTGSTSWFRTIKSLTPPVIQDILAKVSTNNVYTKSEMEKICFDYNSSIQYPADDSRLRYVIRDMILKHKWREPNGIKAENFCEKFIIRSQCYDGGLFIDGGIAVNFNAGTTAVLEILKEDALQSIILLD